MRSSRRSRASARRAARAQVSRRAAASAAGSRTASRSGSPAASSSRSNSTSIYLIQAAITALVELFPDKEIAPLDRDEFNRLIDLEYDRIRDFLILHYHATERSDTPFWDYVRTMDDPGHAPEKIELFRRRGRVVKYREGVFLDASWIAVYLGQRIIPEGHDHARGPAALGRAGSRGMRSAPRATFYGTVKRMPDHRSHDRRAIARWRHERARHRQRRRSLAAESSPGPPQLRSAAASGVRSVVLAGRRRPRTRLPTGSAARCPRSSISIATLA